MKTEVNEMKNEHVIIAAMAIALTGTGYYAYTQHQQAVHLQTMLDGKKNELTWYNNQISELLEKNTDLQKQIDNQPAPVVVTQSDGLSDALRQLDEDELRQKASDYLDKQNDYLDKVNRQLNDEHSSKYMKLHDYTK